MSINGIGLTSHRTHLRELSGLDLAQQVRRSGSIHLEKHLKDIEGAVPMVLMPPIEQKLELGDVERQIDLRHATNGRYPRFPDRAV